jgi:putative ABC transport system permease protein
MPANFKIILRSISRNKVFSGINIFGLAVGIAAVMHIYRIVEFELSFNKNFKNYDRIVRVVGLGKDDEGNEEPSVCIPSPAGEALVNSIAQFEHKSRIKEVWVTLTVPNPAGGAPLKKFTTSDDVETAFFVEPDFFQIFDFQWLAGDPTTAVDQPNTIVLNKSWAEKCFDNWENAIGKTVLIDNIFPVEVKGVVEDLPANCDFTMPYLISYTTLKGKENHFFLDDGDWDSCSSNNQVYATLSDPSQMDAAIAAVGKVGEKEYTGKNGKRKRFHSLQPLSEMHYDERYNHSGTHITPKSRLKVLASIGALILVLACFNFINLATAQSTLRAKEVGVRKTLGGGRGQLVAQFMGETGVIVLMAVALGVTLAYLSSPLLKFVSQLPDATPFWDTPAPWLFLLATAVVVTLLAGLYPSMALARFDPVKALRSNAAKGMSGGAGLRKSLVVLQFVIAQALIIGAIVTIMQLDYIQSQNLGFKKDLVYTFGFGNDSLTVMRQTALQQALLEVPSVEAVSFSSDQPLSGNTWGSNFRYASRPEDEPYSTTLKFTDDKYQETYGIKLLAGRWLAPADTMREVVLNQTMLKKLGVNDPKEAIGENYLLWGSRRLKVVGVAEDFHTHSFREEHQPLTMTTYKQFYWEAGVKIRPGSDLAATTAAIRSAFDQVLPEQVFSGRFLDEQIARFYEDDQRLAATCKGFGLLAILISCLGLFGLATHTAQQRVKEIGVRKVLGATVSNIVGLLSKDFLILVALALFIAAPLAYFFMDKWLQDFAYRIDIQWWVFVLAGAVAVAVAFLTVSYQSVKAALANPVKSLRSE